MNKAFYIIFSLLFIIFLIIFFSGRSNYIEYSNYKKMKITSKQIKKFEKDISEGKNVNINNYIDNETKDYSNNVTKVGDFISNNLFKSLTFIFKITYNFLEKLIG